MAEFDPFFTDLLHLLQRYAMGVDVALKDNLAALAEPRAAASAASPASPSSASGSKTVRFKKVPPREAPRGGASAAPGRGEEREARRKEELAKILRAAERYRTALAKEHSKLLSGRKELAEAHIDARTEMLEMARRHYGSSSSLQVGSVLDEQLRGYLAQMRPAPLVDENGNPTTTDIEAEREWSKQVCKIVVQDLRHEWRTTQKKILFAIARELRFEHQAAANVLEKSLKSWTAIEERSQAIWDAELQRAQEHLDKLAEGYRKALQVLYEAELREVRQHVAEQVDFFRGEIKDAERAEQAEKVRCTAQIRRMQVAILKWNHDYVRDAEQKAREAAARRRLAFLDGLDPFEEGEEEPPPAASAATASAPARLGPSVSTVRSTRSARTARTRTDGGDGSEAEDPEAASDAELEAQARRVAEDVLFQSGMGASRRDALQAAVTRGMLRRLRGQASGEALGRARGIVTELHRRLPADPSEVRSFLLRAEAAVPASSDILRLYEEHLAEHGVMVPLAVAAHRPPNLQEDLANFQDDAAPPEGPAGLSPRRRLAAFRAGATARKSRGAT